MSDEPIAVHSNQPIAPLTFVALNGEGAFDRSQHPNEK
jgi:hypothetical protein